MIELPVMLIRCNRLVYCVLAVVAGSLLFFSCPTLASNQVYVDVVKAGTTKPVDTLFIGNTYTFRIWIENDVKLSSMRIASRFWITTGAKDGSESMLGTYFTWINVGGYGPSGLNTGKACVTIVTGSRMDPPAQVWDFGSGFRVWEYNVNEVSPDTIGVGGVAASKGLTSGPLQHMISIYFKPGIVALAGTPNILSDSAMIVPGGGLIFVDFSDNLIIPEYSNAGPWHIRANCGDANGDGLVNIGDVVLLINYVFKSGSAPKPTGVGNVNCDEETNVGDVVYLINYVFKGGPAACAGC